jgi:hypothetical protein
MAPGDAGPIFHVFAKDAQARIVLQRQVFAEAERNIAERGDQGDIRQRKAACTGVAVQQGLRFAQPGAHLAKLTGNPVLTL